MLFVGERELLDLRVVHVAEHAGGSGGAPGRILQRAFVETQVDARGVAGLFVDSGLEEVEHADHHGGFVLDVGAVVGELGAVVAELLADGFFGFVPLMAMVHGLDGGFEAERDEQACGDGEQVDEEIANAVNAVVGRVDVQHCWFLPGVPPSPL